MGMSLHFETGIYQRRFSWGKTGWNERAFAGCETPLANEIVAPVGRARAPSLFRPGYPKQAHRFHGGTNGSRTPQFG